MTARRQKIGMSDAAKQKRLDHIGGSDARIIMSGVQTDIEFLWKVKRREVEDYSCDDVLLVQLGNATEELNAFWFEKQTGMFVTDEQKVCLDEDWPVAACTLDGLVRETPDGPALGVFEAKYMLPYGWSLDEAIVKYMAQLQHNMMVTKTERSWLSVITGAGQWQAAEVRFDEFYGFALRDEEEKFWECVQTGQTPGVPIVQVPTVERVRVIDMTGSNQWAALANTMVESLAAFERYKRAEKGIKKIMPVDAKAASGHGIKITMSKANRMLLRIEGESAIKKQVKEEFAEFDDADESEELAA